MSKLEKPCPARFFTGLIFRENAKIMDCIHYLKTEFGELIFESESFDFNSTKYYQPEMGEYLKRKFIFFGYLIERNEIIERKIIANKIEDKFSTDGQRSINIDPGYIAPEHLILATGKGYSHRAYLGEGVYAELTLAFEKNRIRTFDWTYPDYKVKNIQDMFSEQRKNYLTELREGKLI